MFDLITDTMFKWPRFVRDKIITSNYMVQNKTIFSSYLNMPAIESADIVIKPFTVTFYERDPKMYLLFGHP